MPNLKKEKHLSLFMTNENSWGGQGTGMGPQYSKGKPQYNGAIPMEDSNCWSWGILGYPEKPITGPSM